MLNEKDNIPRMLDSLINQSLKPAKILIGDNQSDDGSQQLAREILANSGLDYEITTVPRRKEFGKWNYNNVLWWLSKSILKEASSIDFIGTIDSDVVLEPRYLEKLVLRFARNPRIGIAGGPISPDGRFPDSFPLEGGRTPWGANRLYSARCWFDLNALVDIRYLPAIDTDLGVLAAFRGYQALSVSEAMSLATRSASVEKGATRGGTDCMHDLPLWWAVARSIRKNDLYYLAGFMRAALEKHKFKSHEMGHCYLERLRQAYRYASAQAVTSRALHALGAS